MEKYAFGLWRADGSDPGSFRDGLASEWLPAQLAGDDPAGLILRRPLAGAPDPALDALVFAWSTEGPEPLAAGLRARAGRIEIWRVDEQRQKSGTRDWPDGEPTPGVAMVALMRGAPGKTREECQRYWVEQHTPLALRVHQGLFSYVQNVVLDPLTAGGADVIGIAELQFRSAQDYRDKMFVPPEARSDIFADVPKFMSLESSQTIDMDELIARTPPPA